MSVKSWVHGRINGLVARGDLPPREQPVFGDAPAQAVGDSRASVKAPPARDADVVLVGAEHLGAYAALIGAVRDELEHFVASQVRLHLAIADRDRFLLTAVAVRCRDDATARQRLAEFVREFKPEQIKRFLSRDVIGALPNAAAIDLSQFAGLANADDVLPAAADDGGEYRELLEALRSTPLPVATRPYEVSVLGRWVETDAARALPPAVSTASSRTQARGAPITPMAGQRCEFDVEDADGRRRVVLPSVVPGRRYVVGKGEGCDIRINATYASRRHAELWQEAGQWWAADAGSTNGLRVETADGAPAEGSDDSYRSAINRLESTVRPELVEGLPSTGSGRSEIQAQPERGSYAIESEPVSLGLPDGARLVLSARAQGPAHDYAWLAPCADAAGGKRGARGAPIAATPITPIAAVPPREQPAATPSTPLTAVMVSRPSIVLCLTVEHAGGARTIGIHPGLLPFNVGRSRNQGLVIDRRHEGVSGQHLEIVELDDGGATVLVHGDNGVWLDGARHGLGARLRWPIGQAMVLGEASGNCRLTLALAAQEG